MKKIKPIYLTALMLATTMTLNAEPLQQKPISNNAQGGISLGADFSSYSFRDLGAVPNLPAPYGGLTFKAGDTNTLLIGGNANSASGKIYEIRVERGPDNHIIGFSGTVLGLGNVGEYNDGGITYAPNGVLLTAQWPQNKIGQTKVGSLDEDKISDMAPLGVSGTSVSAIQFVPSGFAGAGQLKLVSWSEGNWYSVGFSEDGSGTYNFTSATQETVVTGGPEGFVYIDANNEGFSMDSLLVSEYSANRISAYEIDSNGDPITSTQRIFLSGLTGAEGAVIDPLTGDFLFSTFGGSNQVIVVSGFSVPNNPPQGNTLSVSFSGGGVVTSSPLGINCPSDCSEFYPIGTVVTLSVNPLPGFTFEGWDGACTGLSVCTITMGSFPINVTPNFGTIPQAPQVIPFLTLPGYIVLILLILGFVFYKKPNFKAQ